MRKVSSKLSENGVLTEQKITALAVSQGRDLQLEKAVEETLKLLEKESWPSLKQPAYSKPAKNK